MIARIAPAVINKILKRPMSEGIDATWRNSFEKKLQAISGNDIIKREPEIVGTILRNTEISRDHLTPELKLFLLTPRCALYHASQSENNLDEATRRIFHDPFWSIYWPGGQVLTRFILDEGESIFKKRGTKVLDLGAGCGASGIAARLVGAEKVSANDIDETACLAIVMNAVLNGVDISISNTNLLLQSSADFYDFIFVGDLLYDEEIAEILTPWLKHARNEGSQIYLGDPGRHGLTEGLKKQLKLIRQYSLPENVRKENHGYDSGSVWQFK